MWPPSYTSYSQKKKSQVLRVLEISEILVCHIFGFFWLQKVTSTLIKRLTEYDVFVVEGRRYISSGQEI